MPERGGVIGSLKWLKARLASSHTGCGETAAARAACSIMTKKLL